MSGIRETPAPDWQPIETAPKDSERIDLWAHGERYTDCYWMRPTNSLGRMAWCRYSYDIPYGPVYNEVKDATHWMPLPEPPVTE
jgi:hypothetical protein